ncbi:glycosyltransferase family protein [Haloquadratum walsbyi]|uniref:glycosyltransferase n=1 Tax=Haloquadratum walsbyi TaxID=293091 RepID=UPI0013053B33|nr:glycosyltransferase [Haloquadratum walsbyi]
MSQPVLLNRLNEEVGIELHLLKNHPEEIDLIDFDYEHYSLDVPNVKIRGHTALWITQHKLRKRWWEYLKQHLSSDFDLVIGMNNVATAAVDAANVYDIPSLFFIRNLAVSGQEQYSPDQGYLANFKTGDFGAKVQYPFFVKNFTEYQRGMAESSRVIANSEYVLKRLQEDFGVNPSVIYPPVPSDDYRVEEREMVNT